MKATYLEHILACIEMKRQSGIENANKTDLYSNDELTEHMKWYADLTAFVMRSPPNGYVRALLIQEDDQGQIKSIRYDLFDKDDGVLDTEFRLLY